MNSIELELKLKEIDQSSFQRICDYILTNEGYNIVSYGNCEGKSKTRKGTPDSYIFNEKLNSFVFIEYTTQNDGLDAKIIDDIGKCFEKAKSFKQAKLTKILYFSNSNNVSPTTIDSAKVMCSVKNVDFKIYTLSEICSILKKHKPILREMFNDSLLENEIFSLEEFVCFTKKYKGVDHSFKYCKREEDESKLIFSINNNCITLVYGESGVGKSMLVVQTLKKIGQEVYCLNSSNEDAIEEIDYILDQGKDFILFIDDVNEVSSFLQLLSSFNLSKLSTFKIVCTIREYALPNVINILNEFKYDYDTLRIKRLDDESIKTILSNNLNITNDKWLNKICLLSKGNPRLAFMAGKVAIDKGVKNLIDSKTIMREYFEIANSEFIKGIINDYYDVLGVIAFLKRMDVEDIASYMEILRLCNINIEKFKSSIGLLRDSELIDVFEDRVLQINDQNLSDYFIEKAFIEKKMCSIFDLVTNLILTKKSQIIDSLNIILDIYSSNESRLYIESEVIKAWSYLSDKKEFDVFINIFYFFDINKALLYCYNKIKATYNKCSLNNLAFETTTNQNNYIEMIFNIAKHNDSKEAFNLLLECLDYEEIRDYALDALKRFTILTPELFDDNSVNNDLIFIIKEFNCKAWFNDVLQIIIDKSLEFDYEYSSYTNDRTILFNSFSLKDSYAGIIDYRNKIWNLSLLLDDTHKYALLTQYHNKNPKKYSKNIFLNDVKHINTLIESVVRIDNIQEKIFKVRMMEKFSYLKKDKDILRIHDETDIDLYILIIDPNNRQLEDFSKNNKYYSEVNEFIEHSSLENIKSSLFLCDSILLKDQNLDWKINAFLDYLIKGLNKEILLELLNDNFLSSISCKIKMELINANYLIGNKEEIFDFLLRTKENDDTIECFMSIFNCINKNEISDDLRKIFNECFKRDLLSYGEIMTRRKMSTLLFFSVDDLDFIDKILQIYELIETNKMKAHSWFSSLFDNYIIKANDLVKKFINCGQIKLLEDLVLYVIKNGIKFYELSKYVYCISDYDDEFLRIIVKVLLDYRINLDHNLLSGLWDYEDSFKKADIIFDEVARQKHYFMVLSCIEYIFVNHRKQNDAFLAWALNKVKNINKENEYNILLELVSKCTGEKVIFIYKELVVKKIPIDLFKKILSYPLNFSWSGSEVNVVNKKIKKMKQILAMLPEGIEYLEYKSCLSDYINILNEQCKKIRIREKLDFYDRY